MEVDPMHQFRQLLAAVPPLVLVLATGAGKSDSPGSALKYATEPGLPRIEITSADVEASNAKVKMAYNELVSLWGEDFNKIGARFAPPQIARYRGAARTSCGYQPQNNAAYCPRDNTIYFDDIFVAAQAKLAASQLRTDGDMAAVGIIAHEMGHAVAIQLGDVSRYTYDNESTADCLAGAFTEQAQQHGSIEAGDIDEAFFGMSMAGDPTPQLTGNERVDRMIVRRASLMGHGTRDQRMQNFRRGLDGGPGACLSEFRGIK
jgi:predicted metalloprotease